MMRMKRMTGFAVALMLALSMGVFGAFSGLAETASHTHDWHFTAAGDTITARCDGAGACDITEGLTLTIRPPEGLSYSGKPKPAALNEDFNKKVFGRRHTITYVDGENNYSSAAPVNAGTYTAYVGPMQDMDMPRASVRFTIEKADLPVVDWPEPVNSSYDGELHALVKPPIALPAGAVGLQYSADGGANWIDAIPAAVNANTYTLMAKYVGDANHNDALCPAMTATIDEAPNGIILPTMTAEGEDAFRITWTEAHNVDGYDVFLKKCSDKSTGRKVAASVEGATEVTIDGLKKKTNYKACVRAWVKKGSQKEYVLELSPVVHAITGGIAKGVVNPGSLKVDHADITLRIDRTIRVSGSVQGVKKGRLRKHAPRLRFISSDPGVATVSKKGDVTAVGGGTCEIYVLTNNGIWKSVHVTVDPSPERVWLNKPRKYMKVGQKQDLGAVLKLWPGKSVTGLTWKSSNEDVATVDQKGMVTAVKKGKATITVTSTNGKHARLNLTVNRP